MTIINLLQEVLGNYTQQKDEYLFTCPFCHTGNKKKLSINIINNKWKCWVCGSKGGHILWLLKKLNVSRDILIEFKKLFSDDDIKIYKSSEVSTVLTLPEEYNPLWKVKKTYPYLHAMHYLNARGITTDDIIRYRIGYCESGDYANRIIIPSYDEENKLNYFVARSFFPSNLKYKNPLVSKNIVAFENMINYQERVILCEGVFDAMALKQNAIPLLGKTIPPILLERLVSNKTPEIIIFLDNDAKKEALKNKEILNKYGLSNVKIVHPEDKDASEMGHAESIKLLNTARTLSFKDTINEKLKLIKR